MRVRVAVVWFTMRRPARVGNAGSSFQALRHQPLEIAHLALALVDAQRTAAHDGHPRGVVATVFEATLPLH